MRPANVAVPSSSLCQQIMAGQIGMEDFDADPRRRAHSHVSANREYSRSSTFSLATSLW